MGQDGALLLAEKMDLWMHDILGLKNESIGDSIKYKTALKAAMEIVFETRKNAREKKDWTKSDSIREKLLNAGITIKDGADGSDFSIS